MARILIIDDSESDRDLLRSWLEEKGHQVTERDCPEEALQELSQSPLNRYSVVLLDNKMPKMHGLDLLKKFRERCRAHVPVILITGHGEFDDAITANVLGAHEYFTKPDNLGDADLLDNLLWPRIESALLLDDLATVPVNIEKEHPDNALKLVGSTLREQISRHLGDAARCSYPVLIEGETGTGKELIAQAILRHSNRMGGPFQKVWCEQFRDPQMLAGKLFGSNPDLATGSSHPHIGEIEQANGGALLLDDLDAIQCPSIQERLVQLIEDGTIRRENSLDQISVDVRILATSLPGKMAKAVQDGTLTEKLSNRFKSIVVSPLRERGCDIEQLALHFLKKSSVARDRGIQGIDRSAIDQLQQYTWPANVWELQEVIRDALLVSHGSTITASDLKLNVTSSSRSQEIVSYIRQAVRAALESNATDVHSKLHPILLNELIRVTWDETCADLSETAKRIGQPVSDVADILRSLGYHLPPVLPESEAVGRDSGPSASPLPPSRAKAYQAYKWALEQCPALETVTDEEVFDWLRQRSDFSDGMIPRNFETFSRYLRLARRYFNESKVIPQAEKECGKSIVRLEQI